MSTCPNLCWKRFVRFFCDPMKYRSYFQVSHKLSPGIYPTIREILVERSPIPRPMAWGQNRYFWQGLTSRDCSPRSDAYQNDGPLRHFCLGSALGMSLLQSLGKWLTQRDTARMFLTHHGVGSRPKS